MFAEFCGAAMRLPFLFAAMLLHGQTTGLPAPMSGDCSSSAAGAVTCGKTAGVAFAASATTDATNAANISSGVLPAARLSAAGVTGALGYVPAAGSQHVAGALVMLDMLPAHLSAGVMLDQSGNGNNGVLGGTSGTTSPASGSQGLTFALSDNVTLPAAVNGARTFEFAVNLPAYGAQYGGAVNTYPLLMGSSQTSGFDLLIGMVQGGPYSTRTNAVSFWVNGASTTVPVPIAAGNHTIIVTLGTGGGDLDHVYLDGVEYATYGSQGANAGKTTSGVFSLGRFATAAPFNGSGFIGTMYEFAARTAELTAAQVLVESGAMAADAGARGVVWNPLTWTRNAPNLVAVGDSITCGQGVGSGCSTTFVTNTAAWPSLVALPPQLRTPALTNLGIPGYDALSMSAAGYAQIAPLCKSEFGPNLATLLDGTNDLNNSGIAGPGGYVQVGSSIATQVQTLTGLGCRVFVGTLIDRTGQSAANQNLNAVIRQSWKAWGAAGLMDFAADPNLGATGASANTTYFQADAIHPTAAGHALMAAVATRALGYAFGASEAAPTVVTAATYAMLPSDGAVDLQPGAATTVTLPSCVGVSGATFRVNNPQSAFAVTVKTLSSAQTVNGLDESVTGLTVPANATLTVRAVPNAAAVSGCHWEM